MVGSGGGETSQVQVVSGGGTRLGGEVRRGGFEMRVGGKDRGGGECVCFCLFV